MLAAGAVCSHGIKLLLERIDPMTREKRIRSVKHTKLVRRNIRPSLLLLLSLYYYYYHRHYCYYHRHHHHHHRHHWTTPRISPLSSKVTNNVVRHLCKIKPLLQVTADDVAVSTFYVVNICLATILNTEGLLDVGDTYR